MNISRLGCFAVALGVLVALAAGCTPSIPYMLGTGFYSEGYSQAQVQAAANNGKLKFLGRFTEDNTACGLYVQEWTDNRLVLPVVKSHLTEAGGNAADHIVAKWNFEDFLLGITLVPAIAGCRSYTISGELLQVQP